MNQNRIQKLTQLIQESMEYLVIREISRDEPLSLDKYSEALRSRRTSYRPNFFELTWPRIYPDIENGEVKRRILGLIQEEFEEYIHDGSIQSPTYMGSAVDALNEVLSNLLKNAIVWGEKRAVQDFIRCVESESGTYLRIALLEGARVEEEIEVFDGVRLVPLPASPEEFPTFMPGGAIFDVTERAFSSRTLVVMECSVSPLFRKPQGDEYKEFQKIVKSNAVPDFDLDRFCQSLSLASNAAISSKFEWEYFDENEISMISCVGGCILFIGAPDPSFAYHDFTEISDVQIQEAKRLYSTNAWKSSGSKAQRSLQLSIDRWIKSKRSRDSVDSMIDLGIALESLYLHLLKSREQLSFTFRLRAAWYLGIDMEDRKRRLAEFRAIYEWRSRAVHEGILPEQAKICGESFTQSRFIDRAQDLCLESIMKVVREGAIPDWDVLILGGDLNEH